jgi:hypothetical protein
MRFEFRPFLARALPWLAIVALWLAFELPYAVGPDRATLSPVRPTGDFLVVLTLLWISTQVAHGRALRRFLVVFVAVLVVIRIDRTIFFVLSRSEPLLYDQLFLVRHFLVLLSDLLQFQSLFALALAGLASYLVVRAVRALLRGAAPLAAPEVRRPALLTLGAAWALLMTGTLLGRTATPYPWVRWMVPDLVRNADESIRLYRSVNERITTSPYRVFDRLSLTRKPDVLLFFVESYGKLVAEHPDIRPIWVDRLNGMDERLTRAGWYSASAFATAPVSGGRSWLAVSSVLMGTTVQYEAVYRQLVQAGERVPNLARFFAHQGYDTVNLAPSDRARPGVIDENTYGYGTYLRYDDLDYVGPKMGWGIVPDQYALGFAEEHVLSRLARPLFLHFHMVSSHAPWRTVPDYVQDWRSWNDQKTIREPVNTSELGNQFKRYSRNPLFEAYLGNLTAAIREGYERSVFYDLRVIEDYLAMRQKDSLVIVMGDHQPPVVSPESDGFEVPIHVFARDPRLLEEFLAHGFTRGLVLPAERPAVVKHAALFSLFVRSLARASGAPNVPAYFQNGVSGGS